jgi:hypothetical protein
MHSQILNSTVFPEPEVEKHVFFCHCPENMKKSPGIFGISRTS